MRIRHIFMIALGAVVFTTAFSSAAVTAAPPFGDPESIEYSQKLWKTLQAANLVGAKAIISKTYKGQHPHGAVLDTIEGQVAVEGHSGVVIVKRNYGGEDSSISKVADNPGKYLSAVTVMYKREVGYDADNKDWFWVKYKPDGSLDANPEGMKLAGRVAKGKSQGCIACHAAAPGGDYVYNNNRYK